MTYRPRTLVSPDAFRVSRDDVDVTDPPADTPEYLAMSSTWGKVEKRHAVVFVKGKSLNPPVIAKVTPRMTAPPLAVLFTRIAGSVLLDTQTHIDEFGGAIAGIKYEYISDTYVLGTRNTAAATEVLFVQQGQRHHFAHGDDVRYSAKRFDFFALVFKRDA